jgi:hypothetical protein
LLTVETEANGDSKSTNERGPSLVVRWDFHVGARDFCPALAALVGPVLKIFFFSLYTISIHLSPSPSKLGRQSFRVADLLMHISCSE